MVDSLTKWDIRSCFAMTEPDVASSDATNISSSIISDGDNYVINGRKWWTSNAINHAQKYVFLWELQILKILHTQDKVKF